MSVRVCKLWGRVLWCSIWLDQFCLTSIWLVFAVLDWLPPVLFFRTWPFARAHHCSRNIHANFNWHDSFCWLFVSVSLTPFGSIWDIAKTASRSRRWKKRYAPSTSAFRPILLSARDHDLCEFYCPLKSAGLWGPTGPLPALFICLCVVCNSKQPVSRLACDH